jgi:hypothetical protein
LGLAVDSDYVGMDIFISIQQEIPIMVQLGNTSNPTENAGILAKEMPNSDTRAIAPRPSKDAQGYWKKMDRHFEEILNDSHKAFKIKTIINIMLVIIGTILIANAITYTWLNGTSNGWSFFSGGIGIAALISIFFYKSQDAISKAVANLSVVDMVFKSHYRAYESITDYDYKADNSLPHREIGDLKETLELLEKTTKAHVELIQQVQLVQSPNSQDTDDNKSSKEAAVTTTTITQGAG